MSPMVKAKAGSPASRAASASDRVARSGGQAAKAPDTAGVKVRRKKLAGNKAMVRKELPAFTRQLAAMLGAGMPIVASLDALRQQIAHPTFKMVISNVKQGIENGLSFSEALKAFPTVFDQLYTNMIRGGESGGQLAETMTRIADFLESSARLRRKVKAAMSYPIAVMCIAIAMAALMLTFIVPVFTEMFSTLGEGAKLPLPTRILVGISDSLRHNLPIVLPVLAVVAILFNKWKRTPKGELVLANIYLRLPVVGALVQKVAMARFARTFAQLVHSGVPILTALEITAGATGNKVVEAAVRAGQATVEKGESLSAALAERSCFTPILVHMLAAGEKTGKVDEMMDSIAGFYEEEVDAMLSGLTALIEPLLMVFLGVTIGTIVVCMFLPIFKLPELLAKNS